MEEGAFTWPPGWVANELLTHAEAVTPATPEGPYPGSRPLDACDESVNPLERGCDSFRQAGGGVGAGGGRGGGRGGGAEHRARPPGAA
eukprot:1195597-Prorocentrum_minimum.AAC.7